LDKYRGSGKPLHIINHGLARHFLGRRIRPAALPGRFKIKTGYVGNLLYPHLDWKSLFRVVDGNPRVGFYFIGPFDAGDNLKGVSAFADEVRKLKSRKNVFLLGPKPSRELPAYLAAMDIFLMSYTGKTDLERLANPHKILEYLSAGKPVVSHYIGEYADKRELVHMAEDNAELPELFRRVVAGLRAKGQRKMARRRIAYASQNTYFLQVRRIERILYGAGENK
jgi:glycosyltransferase involved in cell wall biosynthesis